MRMWIALVGYRRLIEGDGYRDLRLVGVRFRMVFGYEDHLEGIEVAVDAVVVGMAVSGRRRRTAGRSIVEDIEVLECGILCALADVRTWRMG